MPHNAPNDRLSRLINSVCQAWEEEASATEGKLVTLANRIIADNEHEKMRMQHSFKSMMNMKNSEIGALSQEIRKLNFALEQEAKENMENKRTIRALTLELDALKGNNTTSALSSLEDDVSSLHSASTAGGGGVSVGSSNAHVSTTADDRDPLDLSSHGNNPRQYDPHPQPPPHPQQGLFSTRSPQRPGGGGQSQQQMQHGYYPSIQQHDQEQQRQQHPQHGPPRDYLHEPSGMMNDRGGEGDSFLSHPHSQQSLSSDRYFSPGQGQWREPSLYGDNEGGHNDGHFKPSGGGPDRTGGSSNNPQQWESMLDYGDREASLISILDDREDSTGGNHSGPQGISSLSLSDGPPGFHTDSLTPPGFDLGESNLPPGFNSGPLESPTDTHSGGGEDDSAGGESTEQMLNHIRLQSKSSKLDASPVSQQR